MYDIQLCFICRPSDSTVSEDAVIEHRTVATKLLAVRRSNHSARSQPHSARSRPLVELAALVITFPKRTSIYHHGLRPIPIICATFPNPLVSLLVTLFNRTPGWTLSCRRRMSWTPCTWRTSRSGPPAMRWSRSSPAWKRSMRISTLTTRKGSPDAQQCLVLLWCCGLHPDPHKDIFLNADPDPGTQFFFFYFFRLQVQTKIFLIILRVTMTALMLLTNEKRVGLKVASFDSPCFKLFKLTISTNLFSLVNSFFFFKSLNKACGAVKYTFTTLHELELKIEKISDIVYGTYKVPNRFI